jgi:hypothetical protein
MAWVGRSRSVADLVRLRDSCVLREYEQAADIGFSLNGLDANVEVDHSNLIAPALAQPDLLGDAHIAGAEALLDELQKLVAFDPGQSRTKRRANERDFGSRRDRCERGAICETGNVVGTERRKDREWRFFKETQEVQVEAARVRSTGERRLREGGAIRGVEEREQSRDDALDIVRANTELEGDLLVGEPAPYSAEYFALALG